MIKIKPRLSERLTFPWIFVGYIIYPAVNCRRANITLTNPRSKGEYTKLDVDSRREDETPSSPSSAVRGDENVSFRFIQQPRFK